MHGSREWDVDKELHPYVNVRIAPICKWCEHAIIERSLLLTAIL